ncbi:Outer membrane usher protein FimD precursor [compost metagenome]
MALSGGVVAHQNGVTFSPWPVKDTFAIIDAGNDLAGTRINTPTGDVWTDHWGKAIVPSVNPYHKVRVELDTNTLPQDVDVENGFSEEDGLRVCQISYSLAKGGANQTYENINGVCK